MKKIILKAKLGIILFVFTSLCVALLSCSSVDYFSSMPQNYLNDKNEINLVTYNIKAIYEKEESQINNLVSFINREKFDFVVFQELFDESTRDNLIDKTQPHFNTFISRVDYNSFPEFIFQDAGLFLISKYARIDLSPIDFGGDIKNSNGVIHMILEKEFSKTNDFLANKSVLGALFSINDSTQLFLFTTHVQAAGTTEHKQYQLKQIKTFIETAVKNVVSSKTIKHSENLIVLLAGDFNSNAYDIDRFARLINLLGYPRDLHKEFHGSHQEYTFRGRSRRYDYIFSYDNIESIKLKRIDIQSIGVENVLDDYNESISDHRGIKTILKIN